MSGSVVSNGFAECRHHYLMLAVPMIIKQSVSIFAIYTWPAALGFLVEFYKWCLIDIGTRIIRGRCAGIGYDRAVSPGLNIGKVNEFSVFICITNAWYRMVLTLPCQFPIYLYRVYSSLDFRYGKLSSRSFRNRYGALAGCNIETCLDFTMPF